MLFRRIFGVITAAAAAAAMLAAMAPTAFARSLPTFTDEEKSFIEKKNTVRIGFVQDRVPVSFSDKNGDLAGISRYIFDRVAVLTGLTFEYVPLPAGDVTYDYLIDGGYDLVSSVEFNRENQNARGILISEPYLSSRKVVVAREGLNFSFDANLSVAISTGSQTIRKVLGAQYPNFEIDDYPSITDCFDAIYSGEADLLMQNQYVAEYWISKPIYEKLSVIPVLGLDDQLCFSAVVAFGGGEGPAEETGEILINILNKAIECMSEDEIGSYIIRAVSENKYVYNFGDVLYRYRYAFTVLGVSVVVILILTAILARLHVNIAESKLDAKVKERFISTMSHELRTPLNGIVGLNALMTRTLDDPEKQRKYLRQSDSTAKYLLSLVNDMLDMSGLQSDKTELELKPVDLRLVADTAASIAESACMSKGLHFTSGINLEYPCVMGDAVRIQQIMLHLLDNARKFTRKGGKVGFEISQTADGDRVTTTATVTDTGRGMSEDFQKHIFDTFAQENDGVSKGNQGTGLGLTISSRLARLMGGELSFVSKKDEGSTFTFKFTADRAELPKETGEEDEEPEAQMRVLVAEDNELNAEIVTEILGGSGFVTDLAVNGAEALEMFRRSPVGYYGAVLMDLLMPEMNGFEASRAIRSLDRPDAASVRIIACSANSSREDRENASLSGMNDFLTKPLDFETLTRLLKDENDASAEDIKK